MRHRLAVLFDNLGPYHIARLRALSQRCELLSIEVSASSHEYDWNRPEDRAALHEATLFAKTEDVSVDALRQRLWELLNQFKPTCVFIPGWSAQAALLALEWCARNGVAAICMSESQASDANRSFAREWIKSRLLGLCSAALVGGTPQAEYAAQLGVPKALIRHGYASVDNSYFASRADALRIGGGKSPSTRPYFLTVARFVEKKNLPLLIRAFARYRAGAGAVSALDLVVLGDGAQRPQLEELRAKLGLEKHLHLPGFVQYERLPEYFAFAACFVLASTVEQWGLVVNEAMASSLPVLVSRKCGCSADLVEDGVTGYGFDPTNEEELAALMRKISSLDPAALCAMGERAGRRIAIRSPDRFAQGAMELAEAVAKGSPKRAGWIDRLLVSRLARR